MLRKIGPHRSDRVPARSSGTSDGEAISTLKTVAGKGIAFYFFKVLLLTIIDAPSFDNRLKAHKSAQNLGLLNNF